MGTGCDGDDPGAGTLPEQREEEVGEQERAEVIYRKRQLDPVLCQAPGLLVRACVIDEHVEPGIPGINICRHPADLVLAGIVRDKQIGTAGACALRQFLLHPLPFPLIPPVNDQFGTSGQEPGGSGLPDAVRGARDENQRLCHEGVFRSRMR